MAIHDMNQRAQDWLADHIENFGIALANNEDPNCLITLPHGVVVEIRLNELPGRFSRQSVKLEFTDTEGRKDE